MAEIPPESGIKIEFFDETKLKLEDGRFSLGNWNSIAAIEDQVQEFRKAVKMAHRGIRLKWQGTA